MADRTEVEMTRGLNSKVVRRSLAAVLVQMIDCWKVDKRVWLRDLGARRCLATELVQVIGCQVEDMRTEPVLGLGSEDVGRRVWAA